MPQIHRTDLVSNARQKRGINRVTDDGSSELHQAGGEATVWESFTALAKRKG
jgi:hypothetical protein